MDKTITGLSWFKSMEAALVYYRPYGLNGDDVADKIRNEEIHIGKPPGYEWSELRTDSDGRYYTIKGSK